MRDADEQLIAGNRPSVRRALRGPATQRAGSALANGLANHWAAAARLCCNFFLSICLCSTMLGCTVLPDTSRLNTTFATYDPELLSGVLLVGHEVPEDLAELPTVDDILALTPEMKRFIRARVRGGHNDSVQADRLLSAMVATDLFPKGYYTDETLTATEVYQERSGNCLSYTSLYIAFARHIGVDARFQVAHIPQVWTSVSGFLVKGRHINVLIRDKGTPRDQWLTVDFNQIAADKGTPHRTVSDNFALSSFYNNIAVDHLYASRFQESLHAMRAAINVYPKNTDAWTNLAALYSSLDKREPSIAAYEVALSIDPKHESALTGLEQGYKLLGNTELADHYHSVLAERRQRDPYYHFALAQAAYTNGDYEGSKDSIKRALELNERPAGFHYIHGLAQYKLEDYENALVSLTRATKRRRQLLPRQQVRANVLLEIIEREIAAR